MNNKFSGNYTILVGDKVVAKFSNLITKKGRNHLNGKSILTGDMTCVLSADRSEPSLNRESLSEALTLNLEEHYNGFRDMSKAYDLSFSSLTFKGRVGNSPINISKIGVKIGNGLFSEALIKDEDQVPIDLDLNPLEQITVIYELRLIRDLNPIYVDIQTPHYDRVFKAEIIPSTSPLERVLNLFEPLSINFDNLPMEMNAFARRGEDDVEITFGTTHKWDLPPSGIIPTTIGTFFVSVVEFTETLLGAQKEIIPLNSFLFFNINFKVRLHYDGN